MAKIRLQKYCSEQGLASRRKAEEYIKNGWVKVNGQVVTELGTKVDPAKDKVELSEQAKQHQKEFIYLLLNKPVGYVTNLPREGEKQATDLLPPKFHNLHPVGRLDKDSEGLLLLTNDGVVAHHFASPKFNHEKEYEVTVDLPIDPEVITKYRQGVIILGGKARPVVVKHLTGTTYSFILREGKNRQIRRMLEKFGYQVLRLKRVRIAHLELGKLQLGQYRLLNAAQVDGRAGNS
jgi:pseudouridine synthase